MRPHEELETDLMKLVAHITAKTDPQDFANRLCTALGGHISITGVLPLRKVAAAALRAYGDARAAQERERIKAECAALCDQGATKLRTIGSDDRRMEAMRHMAVKILENLAVAVRALD